MKLCFTTSGSYPVPVISLTWSKSMFLEKPPNHMFASDLFADVADDYCENFEEYKRFHYKRMKEFFRTIVVLTHGNKKFKTLSIMSVLLYHGNMSHSMHRCLNCSSIWNASHAFDTFHKKYFGFFLLKIGVKNENKLLTDSVGKHPR